MMSPHLSQGAEGLESKEETSSYRHRSILRPVSYQDASAMSLEGKSQTLSRQDVICEKFLEKFGDFYKRSTRLHNKVTRKHGTTWDKIPAVLKPTLDKLTVTYTELLQDIATLKTYHPALYKKVMRNEKIKKFMADERIDEGLKARFKNPQSLLNPPPKKLSSYLPSVSSLFSYLPSVSSLKSIVKPLVIGYLCLPLASAFKLTLNCTVEGESWQLYDSFAGGFINYPPGKLIACDITSDAISPFRFDLRAGPTSAVVMQNYSSADFASMASVSGYWLLPAKIQQPGGSPIPVTIQSKVCYPTTGDLSQVCSAGSTRGDCPTFSWDAQLQDGSEGDQGFLNLNPASPNCNNTGGNPTPTPEPEKSGGGGLSRGETLGIAVAGAGGGVGIGAIFKYCSYRKERSAAKAKKMEVQSQHPELIYMNKQFKAKIPQTRKNKFRKVWASNSDVAALTTFVEAVQTRVEAHISQSSEADRKLGRDEATWQKMADLALEELKVTPLVLYPPTGITGFVFGSCMTTYHTPDYQALIRSDQGRLPRVDAIVTKYIQQEFRETYEPSSPKGAKGGKARDSAGDGAHVALDMGDDEGQGRKESRAAKKGKKKRKGSADDRARIAREVGDEGEGGVELTEVTEQPDA